jgi:tRNA threonylcarbamoyladenosine biosynthesis protein TsaB
MVVLGIDTSTPATAVGLRLANGCTLQARDDPPAGQRPGHSTRLLDLASGLLVEAGLDWGELERIAVGVGPGTFTGLRIGIATARGLAQSTGVTLVGVSSLGALAHEANAPDGPGNERTGVLAVIDARRGEVFVAAYDGEVELLSPRAVSPGELGGLLEEARADLSSRGWMAVGDGAVLHGDAFDRLGVLVPHDPSLHRIHGRAICALGEQARELEGDVVPDYRRRPDAEIALEGAC